MKIKNCIRLVTIFFCCALLISFMAGCSQPPKQEVDAAKSALQDAIAAGAEQYVPDELKIAQDLMAKLDAEMAKKDYKTAKQTALQAKAAAENAKAAIEPAKAKAKEAADAAVKEIKETLEKTKVLLAEVEALNLPVEVLKPIQEQMADAETRIGWLEGMIYSDKYKDVADNVNPVKDQLLQIEQSINDGKAMAEELKKAEELRKAEELKKAQEAANAMKKTKKKK